MVKNSGVGARSSHASTSAYSAAKAEAISVGSRMPSSALAAAR